MVAGGVRVVGCVLLSWCVVCVWYMWCGVKGKGKGVKGSEGGVKGVLS